MQVCVEYETVENVREDGWEKTFYVTESFMVFITNSEKYFDKVSTQENFSISDSNLPGKNFWIFYT